MGKRIRIKGWAGVNALQRSANKTEMDYFNAPKNKRPHIWVNWLKNKKEHQLAAIGMGVMGFAAKNRVRKLNAIKDRAADLTGRAGFFGLACFGILRHPEPKLQELKEARETGKKILAEVDECLEKLGAIKEPPEPQAFKEKMRELEESRKLLQRWLRRINALAKKKGQKK